MSRIVLNTSHFVLKPPFMRFNIFVWSGKSFRLVQCMSFTLNDPVEVVLWLFVEESLF